jgi:DNA-directed RNA polymerase subunit RPC12/RpoP
MCARPVPDTAYVCTTCTTKVGDALAELVNLAGEAATTIAKLDHVMRTGGTWPQPEPEGKAASALYPNPLPVNLDAAERYSAAVTELLTRTRRIALERGRPVTLAVCRHETCARVVDRHIIGPVCHARLIGPIGALAMALRTNLDWLRHRQDARQSLQAIQDACTQIVAVVDRPADVWYAGKCAECQEALWPAAGVHTIRCHCGATYDADERRTAMLQQLDDVWLGPEHLAHALAMLSVPVPAPTIRTWADRGRLAPHPDSIPGRPRYRVGSVRELVEQMHAEQRERTLRAAVKAAELAERKRRKVSA